MTRARATTILTGAAFLFLIVLFAIAQYRDLARPPHVDEAEYLHGAARIALGDRIFVDFFEHHPPLFFGMLSLLAPERRGFDEAVAFVARARVFAGLCAAIAIVAAASIVYRATGRLYAPLIFVALMLAAVPVWRNGIGDVRPETAALAFWWVGAALVVLAKRPWLRGLGLGLVFVAAVIVPKWPLESLVVAIVFFTRGAGVPPAFRRASRPAVSAGRDGRREASGTLAPLAIAAITALAGIAATALVADLATTWFYVVTFTRAMWHGLPTSGPLLLYGCPALLRPTVIALPLLLVAWVRFRKREAFREPRLVEFFAALAVASLLEIRFLYYPAADYRYWVMWCFGAAALLAFIAQSVVALVPKAAFVPAVLAVLALVAALEHIPERWSGNEAFWRWTRWMEERLGPNETVWVASRWHPIGAPDASFWWFGADNVIPAAIRLGKVKETELPPCTVPANLKFVGDPGALPAAHACFERLRAEGRIVRTPIPEVWMVGR